MEVFLVVLVLCGVLLVVGYPIWKPAPQQLARVAGPASRVADLEERKESTYAAIRELGFDFRTDKLSEADYHIEIERLKAEAVSIVRQIDEISSVTPTGSEDVEREIAAARIRLAPAMAPPAPVARAAGSVTSSREAGVPATGPFCTQCGRQAGPEDRFCAGCGTPLRQVQ
jgi:hypothetical protein